MGADLWQYDVPGQTEPDAAFEAIQARVFDEFTQRHKIDFPKMVREAVAGRREEIAGARAEGDPYGLADSYEESLAELESLCSQPLPVDKPGQIELFRKIWYAMALGEPIGNLLDTVGITREPPDDPFWCRELSEDEMRQYVGSDKPTIAQSKKACYTVSDILDRGASVCWPYYDNSGNGLGYYFVGASFD